MKKFHLILVSAALFSAAAFAQAGKPCEELKSEIAKKLEANGVKSYLLEVMPKEKDAQGKVVGSCEGGTRKIVYSKTPSQPQTTTADASKH